jgi:hypothetical protein
MKIFKNHLYSTILPILISIFYIAFIIAGLLLIPAYRYALFMSPGKRVSEVGTVTDSERKQLEQKAVILSQRVQQLSAMGKAYLIIDTSNNTFRLYKNHQMIGNGLCSTGSLIHLQVDSTRSWIFETPKGVLQVRNKITNPVWHKPDWAFIEDGLQPPPRGHFSRYEKGVLGDYALDLGNGYLIHGTLYQRLLGKSVTHGCVRLNDSDLELVYTTLDIGSKIYVY